MILILAVLFAAQARECKPDGNVVSINVGFSYDKIDGLNLEHGPLNDSKFYQGMAAGFVPRTKIATMNDSAAPLGSGKAEFLARLKLTIGSAETVNFNYAGHGVLMPDGQFALVLPSIPPAVVKECLTRPARDQRGLARIDKPDNPTACAGLQKYLVTSSDLKGVLGGKRVFGIIDACHAGSFDLGENSSMLLASQANESAHQDLDSGGAFTNTIKRKLADVCDSDMDGDQQVSLSELTTALEGFRMRGNTQVAARGLGRVQPLFQRSNQHAILNNRDWMDCYALGVSAPTKKCERSVSNGEVLDVTGPLEAADSQTSKTCWIKPGQRVMAMESKTATEGRLRVEVPSACGFSVGTVPLARVRRPRDPKPAPAAASPRGDAEGAR